MKTKSHINRISIGRVYNLGNYEHVRYELTVDIPAGESAAKAIIGLEKIIAGMAPLKSTPSAADLDREAAAIECMKSLTPEQWNQQHGHCVGTRAQVIARYKKALAEHTRRRERDLKRAARARLSFDNLHGAARWKDAKLDWAYCDED